MCMYFASLVPLSLRNLYIFKLKFDADEPRSRISEYLCYRPSFLALFHLLAGGLYIKNLCSDLIV